MPTPQKEMIVQEMTEKFSKATSIFLADFTGIDVNTVTELRKTFFEADVEYRIVKNTLAKRSLASAGIEGLAEHLSGVNAYAISYDDPTVPIKLLKKFRKGLDGKLEVKVAYFDGQVVLKEQVEALADLPSKEELLATFAMMLNTPMTQFARATNGTMTGFVTALKALEEQKA
ncbi:MAG TPA: 50S ribosomal protein L10 [Calditrichia bacterium]|nr:50S ribosomal protein L10 [Calditrichia bacterium]